MPNATCIYLYEGERAPVVFDTALVERERESLARWLAENPDLDTLVQQAVALAEREAERLDPSILTELGEKHRADALVALSELQNVLARLVAAREELESGATGEASAILHDLEEDLAVLVERLA
jgi:hypothetical protein